VSAQVDLIRSTLQKRVDGRPFETYEWDDNMSVHCTEPAAELLRYIGWEVRSVFPTNEREKWCSPDGIEFLKAILDLTKHW
jgi:hypothetical protein